jgi:hypothetical protein
MLLDAGDDTINDTPAVVVVEALEKFRTPYHSAIWMGRFFTFAQYNALRDLLLAMKEQEETK